MAKRVKNGQRAKGRKFVGRFLMGPHFVHLYLDFDNGNGYFDPSPEKSTTGVAEIVVGVESKQWSRAVEILVHETMELAFMEIRARFRPAPDYAGMSDTFVFHFNHNQFGEACSRTGEFLADCLPKLSEVFHQYIPKKRGKK